MTLFSLQFRRDAVLPQALRGTPGTTPEGTDIALYEYDVDVAGQTVPYAVAFQGNAGKPIGNYRFRSAGERVRWVEKITAARRAELARKASRKAERATYRHDYKVGEILECSWGYDQTNVEFFQVTETTGRTVTVRKIAASSVDDAPSEPNGPPTFTGKKTALPGEFVGEPRTYRPTTAGGFKLNSYKWARRWDGTPQRFSTYA